MEFKGFVCSNFETRRDQICTTQDPEMNCVRQVDFDERCALSDETALHWVEFEDFSGSKFRQCCDQICITYGPEVNCVMQVDC